MNLQLTEEQNEKNALAQEILKSSNKNKTKRLFVKVSFLFRRKFD